MSGPAVGSAAGNVPHVERRLAAILSADVKDYSRLMGDDDIATVATLTVYREAMATLISQHRGRVVDSPGDNLLAEFSSVVAAVQCYWAGATHFSGPLAFPAQSGRAHESEGRMARRRAQETKGSCPYAVLGVSNVSRRHLQQMATAHAEAPALVQNRCFAQLGWDRNVRSFCPERRTVYQSEGGEYDV